MTSRSEPVELPEELPGDPAARRAALAAVPGGLLAAVEAVLMVADAPVGAAALARALGVEEPTATALVEELAAGYRERAAGVQLRRGGGGWRVHSRADLAPLVRDVVTEGASARLSPAALETLAVIAYRQPVTRARVAAVRGVAVDSVVRTLLVRGLVAEVGQEASGALLYATTDAFLAHLGLDHLDQLPPLAPHLPGGEEAAEVAAGVRAAAVAEAAARRADAVGHPGRQRSLAQVAAGTAVDPVDPEHPGGTP